MDTLAVGSGSWCRLHRKAASKIVISKIVISKIVISKAHRLLQSIAMSISKLDFGDSKKKGQSLNSGPIFPYFRLAKPVRNQNSQLTSTP